MNEKADNSIADIPGILYHYTRQDGLIGIIQNAEIWATHTQYLNDVSEFKHAIDLLNEEIERVSQANLDPKTTKKLKTLKSSMESIAGINVCVASFSEAQDSLPQWRGYASGNSGYGLGFDGSKLLAIAKENGWGLSKCIYDEDLQIEIMRRFVEIYLMAPEPDLKQRSGQSIQNEDDYLKFAYGGWIPKFCKIAPTLKNTHYREEREWRLISKPMPCQLDCFLFRQGPSTLVPYYKLKLAERSELLPLKTVVIGPTPQPQLAAKSVGSFLVKHELRDTTIVHSEIPYRTW